MVKRNREKQLDKEFEERLQEIDLTESNDEIVLSSKVKR
jgi:hypothetical protein